MRVVLKCSAVLCLTFFAAKAAGEEPHHTTAFVGEQGEIDTLEIGRAHV